MPLTEDTLACLGTEVPLTKIDRALKELWESDVAKTRASLINFAIYSEDADSLTENNDLLAKITAENACRALMITCLPEVKPQRERMPYILSSYKRGIPFQSLNGIAAMGE
jgi:hypothetical protein